MLARIDRIASCSRWRIVGCTSRAWSSRSTTSQRCSIALRSGECGGHFSVQKTNLKWFKLCDMVYYRAGSSHQRMGTWWP